MAWLRLLNGIRQIIRVNFMEMKELKIAIIGLGYVGLPLALAFAVKKNVVGFDISTKRIEELKKGIDITGESSREEINNAKYLSLTSKEEELKDANFFIITVPTPVDEFKNPNLSYIREASKIVGKALKTGSYVVYESTVYPGCTEEFCVPILEKFSGLKYKSGDTNELKNNFFYCGYSPERINPGDKVHKVSDIVKVTSGSTLEASVIIDNVYKGIISAGTYRAESIQIAEAAKIIENTQRDINIGFINELSIIFNKMGIETESVLKAAETKWNFISFRPGLVGGHCIGVDPYYLTHKAETLGYKPEIILSGRRLNDSMGFYVASNLIKELVKKSIEIEGTKILIMGLTFKENCPDLRNSKVVDVYKELLDYNCNIEVYDPIASAEEAKEIYNIELIPKPCKKKYDAIILAVAHKQFKEISYEEIRGYCKDNSVIYDLKYLLPASSSDIRL